MSGMNRASEFMDGEDPASGSQLGSALSEMQTTISVSWSGGGQIKPGTSIIVFVESRSRLDSRPAIMHTLN